ncbi:MAG: signal transduction histidine kinase [Candidatus Omnitrophota bacterium]|jgi:signal transduction histidine kinase
MTTPTKILILDDEENILRSLTRLFIDEPFDVQTTTDAEQALAMIAKHDFKVVLSDQRMPNASGVEFLSKVKEISPNTIRILFTGYVDIQAAEDAVNKGEVYRFISKPWNDEDLKSIIRDAVKNYDLSAENERLQKLTQIQNVELKAANTNIRKLYEKEVEFTSTVSHELRTPLASIKMAIDIVHKNSYKALDDKGNKYLMIAKRNVDRLVRLIGEMLSLTKLESGKEPLEIQSTDLNHLVQEVIALQNPVAKEKGLDLKVQLDLELPHIMINADKINQVLNNLISNAIKFTDNGFIEVISKFNSQTHTIEISVNDTGKGIKPEDTHKVFQKFKQLENATEQVCGTGLGLAICQEIISRHAGKIWVESTLEKGSSFIFTLPISTKAKE